MPLDFCCKHVTLRRSERQHKLCDADMFINQKGRVALAVGLDVLYGVGATLDQREDDQSEVVLDRQCSWASPRRCWNS